MEKEEGTQGRRDTVKKYFFPFLVVCIFLVCFGFLLFFFVFFFFSLLVLVYINTYLVCLLFFLFLLILSMAFVRHAPLLDG